MKPNIMPTVRLRATICIELDAADYLEAAELQRRLESHLTVLRSDYPAVTVAVTERRRPAAIAGRALPRELRVRTGKLHAYD
jgi:hypothetical protein